MIKTKKDLNEIVDINEGIYYIEPHIYIENMLKMYIGRFCEINKIQRDNLLEQTRLLCFKNKGNIKTPIISNLPMGSGKSSLTNAFLKTKYNEDPNFGAIIVKKTIQECKDVCIDIGPKELCDIYETTPEDISSWSDSYNNGNEDDFTALNVRGFNFQDCDRFYDAKNFWGETTSNQILYDPRICNTCFKQCKVKDSKSKLQNHRIIAMTHQRLFASNYQDSLLEDILYFNKDGENIKRQMLIIDEKIDMCEIEHITDRDFIILRDRITDEFSDRYDEIFREINNYLFNDLIYPKSKNDNIIKQNVFFRDNRGFRFDDEMLEFVYKNCDLKVLNNLLNLNKILNSSNIATSIPWASNQSFNSGKKIKGVYTFNYIDLDSYAKHFDKTIVQDATANLDIDYCASNAVLCYNLNDSNNEINLYTPLFNANTSKDTIKYDYIKKINDLVSECINIIDNYFENKKTLIVAYKEISTKTSIIKFKNEFRICLNDKLPNNECRIIHQGEFTTGVNELSEYENIIIIGFQHKGGEFYQSKCLTLGIELKDDESGIPYYPKTCINDFTIDTIQQIGRTAYRRDKVVNVCLLHRPDIIDKVVNGLEEYFNINRSVFVNSNYNTAVDPHEKVLLMIYENYKDSPPGTTIKKPIVAQYCNEVGMHPSVINKPHFTKKLKYMNIISNPKCNREFILTDYIDEGNTDYLIDFDFNAQRLLKA